MIASYNDGGLVALVSKVMKINEVIRMNIVGIVLLYLLWVVSFFSMIAAVRGSKGWRWAVVILYLAAAAPFTCLLAIELVNPSEDANIGLGLSYYLLQYVSIVGLIVAILVAIIRYVGRK